MGEKIFNFFKKIFGRRAELERKVALLEVDNKLLKKQYEEIITKLDEFKTVSQRTLATEEPLSYNQIVNEWLNGEEDEE